RGPGHRADAGTGLSSFHSRCHCRRALAGLSGPTHTRPIVRRASTMTLEQIQTRAAAIRKLYGQYLPLVERCETILQQAHDLGWQVALMLNDERTVRVAESLFGSYLRNDFRKSTPLSRLIYGI